MKILIKQKKTFKKEKKTWKIENIIVKCKKPIMCGVDWVLCNLNILLLLLYFCFILKGGLQSIKVALTYVIHIGQYVTKVILITYVST